MPASQEQKWTPEREQQFVQLYGTGMSFKRIGIEMGGFAHTRDQGRSACIGKAHRLGLTPRPQQPRTRVKKETPPRRNKRFVFGNNASPVVLDAVPLPEPELNDREIPLEQRKSIMELTEHTCRFPIGDPLEPGFFFCGAEPETEHPYCKHHKARSVDVMSTRRSSQRRIERLALFQGQR